METRFVYTRGDTVRECADGLTGLKCFTVNETPQMQKRYYALVVHLDPVPSSATQLVVVAEGTGKIGDPELVFSPSEGVYAMESGGRRSNGAVGVGTQRTRVVYVVDSEDAQCFLRAVDETSGSSNAVSARSNWATGSSSDGTLTVHVHPSVARAAFLWSDTRPTTPGAL